MYDGWPYVVATYSVIAATLLLWFAMIGVKLRRLKQAQQVKNDAAGAPS